MATPRTSTATRKRTAPVRSTRNMKDTQDAESFGQDHERAMKSTGPALEAIEPARIHIVDGPVNKDKLAAEKFAQDMLTIIVAESSDPKDEPVPFVIVNGRRQNFIRGQEQQVKRMFVEKLLRMKKTTFTQRKDKDAAGNEVFINIPHTVLETQFAITYDPAGPKGRDWYEKVRREA